MKDWDFPCCYKAKFMWKDADYQEVLDELTTHLEESSHDLTQEKALFAIVLHQVTKKMGQLQMGKDVCFKCNKKKQVRDACTNTYQDESHLF